MHGSLVRGSESIWASSYLRRTLDIRLRSNDKHEDVG